MSTNHHIDAVAQTYATSLFELAEQAGGLEQVKSVSVELDELADLTRGSRELDDFFRSRIIAADDRAESLRRIFEGTVSDLVLRFLLVLNAKDRLGHIGDIAHAFRQMLWGREGRVAVEVISASPMDDAQLERVRSRVREALDLDPVLHNSVDPHMIGGLKLRIGDRLIDASVQSRLQNLRDALTKSGVESIRARISQLIEEGRSANEPSDSAMVTETT
ncbi:MAG: ATP synthase F1 subunit delta [Phycisphaerales bacterium]